MFVYFLANSLLTAKIQKSIIPLRTMLSPRTMSLQIKSRALLKAVDKYVALTNQKNFYDRNFDGSNHHTTNVEADCPLKHNDTFLSSSPDFRDLNNCDSGTLNREDKAALNTKSERKGIFMSGSDCGGSAQGSSPKIDHSIILSNELQGRRPSMISVARNRARRQEFSTSYSAFRKGIGEMNTEDIKSCKGKSVSLKQQRAAEAQMHAPTHSHSSSKCYCTNNSYVREQPNKRYIVQVHGQKQHIPDRLKRTRYQADFIPKQSKSIKWADHNENFIHLQADKMGKDCSESPRSISNQSAHGSQVSQSSLLDKVKMFRESHWSDCHASSDRSLSFHHNCALHYVPNKRLFLEPLHINSMGEHCCPVCHVSSGDLKKSDQQGTESCVTLDGNSYEDQSSHIMVTLPLHLLDSQDHGSKTFWGTSSYLKDQRERCSQETKSCFNLRHHKWNSQMSLSCTTDSLALRFQKKGC